jgi:23S rRNA (adenine1618-N6)-methyltransferase
MQEKKRNHPPIKIGLHPNNKHRSRYDFEALIAVCPELSSFVAANKYDDLSIDFFNPAAVKTLNKALLMQYYGITYWDVPEGYLCPPIPGRADYIHHIAELIALDKKTVRCLDIGTGANLIYPIIGSFEYNWNFVGTEIDPKAIASAQKIIDNNPRLKDKLELRLQSNPDTIFNGIIQQGEHFDLVICNPPFHSSLEEAQASTIRKLKNLKGKKQVKPVLNFGGQGGELYCEGGELQFLSRMIQESNGFAKSCTWFSSLVSKEEHLPSLLHTLKVVAAKTIKILDMHQGQKQSRILAWRF